MIGGLLTKAAGAVFGKKEADDSYFWHFIRRDFDQDTAHKVIDAFKQLQLPLPQSGSLVPGLAGSLLFCDPYGVVIRMEHAGGTEIVHVNDSPWILQPIASLRAGDAIIAICPGVVQADKTAQMDDVIDVLARTGIRVWDKQVDNMGLLPVKTERFPEGFPVLIDRLSVRMLDEATESVKQALAALDMKGDPQTALYGDLQKSFRQAWPEGTENADPEKMKDFWKLCAEKRQEGVLVSGWTADDQRKSVDLMSKRRMAQNAGASYGKMLDL